MNRKQIFKIKKVEFLIISISIVMMVVVLSLPFKAKPFGDITFHKESKNIALYLKGNAPYKEVTISKAPGPILFYTPVYLLVPSDATDNDYWYYAVVFTFLTLIVSQILIYRIGCSFFSKEIAILSIILLFLFPIHFYYSLGILAEVPAFFSLTLALFGWTLISASNKKIGWILFVLGLTFLILNRPNTLLVIPFIGVILVYSYLKRKSFYNQYGIGLIKSVFIIGILSFSVLKVAKSITGNKVNNKQEELLYYVAHQGRYQFREEPLDLRYWDNEIRPDSKDYQNWVNNATRLNLAAKETKKPLTNVYKDFLVQDFVEHPFLFVRQFFVKCFYGHIYVINSTKPADFKLFILKGRTGYFIFLILVNSINILIIIGFLIFLFKEKNLLKYWLFWSIIFSLLIFHGITYMEPRYLFPSRVALCFMSAVGLFRIGIIRRFIVKVSKRVL